MSHYGDDGDNDDVDDDDDDLVCNKWSLLLPICAVGGGVIVADEYYNVKTSNVIYFTTITNQLYIQLM